MDQAEAAAAAVDSMEDDCLVCGKKMNGQRICKMCGMKYESGIIYSGFDFCSADCRDFFIDISKKSHEMAQREIVM